MLVKILDININKYNLYELDYEYLVVRFCMELEMSRKERLKGWDQQGKLP